MHSVVSRQARCEYTNIRMHPDRYWPQAPAYDGPAPYEFYHKPDTPMLIQVKHTQYESSFERGVCWFVLSLNSFGWFV